MGTGSFPGVKSGRGETLTPHHHLMPWSRKSRAIPLLPLWALRPAQSLSAYTRVHFTPTPRLGISNFYLYWLYELKFVRISLFCSAHLDYCLFATYEVLAAFLLKIEVFWDTRSDDGVIFLGVAENRSSFYVITIFILGTEVAQW